MFLTKGKMRSRAQQVEAEDDVYAPSNLDDQTHPVEGASLSRWENELEDVRINKQLTSSNQGIQQAHLEALVGVVAAPQDLLVKLLPHQEHALDWLRKREGSEPSGGILADDMGLGKTVSMIALVVKGLEAQRRHSQSGPRNAGTLIVCPASIINQWRQEIQKKVKEGKISLLVHHGQNRTKKPSSFAGFDVVITTYDLVGRGGGPLFEVQWNRIILDEGHMVRNIKSERAKGALKLRAKHRWCVTGTPIQNALTDLYSILMFLQYKPMFDPKCMQNVELVRRIVKPLMLHRTKKELLRKGELNGLPKKSVKTIYVELDEEDSALYESWKNQQSSLTTLLRLRQICCHFSLVQQDDTAKRMGTKIQSVVDLVKRIIQGTKDKIVIVSQWTSVLKIVSRFLPKIAVQTIDGNVPVVKRQTIVDEFNEISSGPRVMLLSLTAGGVGLNLIGANHLILVDPHWNPQLEEQACDRIYRIGQRKDVSIYRFITSNTVEEKIMELQQKKLCMANDILSSPSDDLSENNIEFLLK